MGRGLLAEVASLSWGVGSSLRWPLSWGMGSSLRCLSRGVWALGIRPSVAAHGLSHMWDLPGPGIALHCKVDS